MSTPVRLPPGRARLVTEAGGERVGDEKDDWDRRSCVFGGQRRRGAARRRDYIDLAGDEIGDHRG
jgi:hypothetical protein